MAELSHSHPDPTTVFSASNRCTDSGKFADDLMVRFTVVWRDGSGKQPFSGRTARSGAAPRPVLIQPARSCSTYGLIFLLVAVVVAVVFLTFLIWSWWIATEPETFRPGVAQHFRNIDKQISDPPLNFTRTKTTSPRKRAIGSLETANWTAKQLISTQVILVFNIEIFSFFSI